MAKLIAQGAEAKIFLDKSIVNKERTPKRYRHPELDEQIRKQRTKREGRILHKAYNLNVQVPKVLNANEKGEPNDKFNLKIEFIDGDRLSETLNGYEEKKQFKAMKQMGEQVAILHKNNLIHGDLTTSNTILKDDKVFIIDFGLGFVSTKIEDKAVDLHLIKQALEAKHFQNHKDLFEQFKKGYDWIDSDKIIERLDVVERRGRYKH